MRDLSILIPARNEMFLQRTIDSVLDCIEADTEIIAVTDGYEPNPALRHHPRLRVIHYDQSIGQRAATNKAAQISTAKYLMKLDAHCSVDKGFDRKLIQPYETGELGMDATTIPRMYNLHGFDWQCKSCGNRTYQGPRPAKCEKCKAAAQFEMVMVWQPRWHRKTDFARFDSTLHFQYWKDYGKRPEAQDDIADLMCSVGACWFMPRERFWQIGGMDESHGSWGQFGVEIACKSWLSGGRHVVNKRTWFTHMFRTQPGFGFPYSMAQSQVEIARAHSRKLWMDGTWPMAKYPLSWLIKKFAPVPEWSDDGQPLGQGTVAVKAAQPAASDKEVTKGMVYYTDNRLDPVIARTVQQQIKRGCNGHQILSVSLEPMEFGFNRVLDLERGILTMFRQILLGLMDSTADIIFFCEHDVLYHPSHFDFTPPRRDVYYYNENTYKVRTSDGQALFYYTKQTSGLCAYRLLLLEHYRQRVARIEQEGRYDRRIGFEPGCHRYPRGIDRFKAERWMSPFPNIDIRHDTNLTPSRFRQDQFRNPQSCLGWKMADEVPGWGRTKGRFNEFLSELR